MKIYYWSPFFTKIATIRAVINSAESLINFSKLKQYEVSLINAIGEWDIYQKSINENINIINLNKNNLINYLPKNSFLKSRFSYFVIFFWNFFKLKNLINSNKPDYLIIHLMTSLPICLSIFLNPKTKIILRISGLPKINIFRYILWKTFEKKIYKITCPTQSTYDYLIKKNIFKKDKIEILNDPIVNIKEYLIKKKESFELRDSAKKKYIVGIGRLTKQKNFELLIKFFRNLLNKKSELELIIIGEGEEEEKLKQLTNEFGIMNKVHFVGYQENVFKYLINSECFILTSLWEDPGFVIVEAALSNVPIISSNCPNGPKEIIKNNGYLFNNNDLNDLSDKFDQFLSTDKEKVLKNKIILKKRIRKFTLFNHYKKLENILE
tara:strand:- start:46 stop:1185 length:1140 start_codon:yes stop_codon:yes gene_type:complete